MSQLYVAFDDTDVLGAERGTGKVGRWFEDELPASCRLLSVVRQQLLVHPAVPYTSHNSCAVVVIEANVTLDHNEGASVPDREGGAGTSQVIRQNASSGTDVRLDLDRPLIVEIIDRASQHLKHHWMEGSDPGLCVAWDGCPALPALRAFGRRAAISLVTQQQARAAAEGAHLSGHGGTNDGIIGAAAGIGLTVAGWSGRFIEYRAPDGRRLREFPDPVRVRDLETAGIVVVSVDRTAPVPLPDEIVITNGWLRPRLWGAQPALPVRTVGEGRWFALASLKDRSST